MSNVRRYSKTITFLATGIVLAVLYNNCSYETQDLQFKESAEESSITGTCDEVLLARYRSTVYPFFRSSNTCMNCHIEGGIGLGLFASPQVEVSFGAFTAAGLSKVSYMATNQLHKPPYTGDKNISAVNTINTKWTQYQTDYLDCLSRSQNGGVNESILTSAKGAPQIYSDQNGMATLRWNLDLAQDLDEAVTRSVPVEITMNVQILYQNISGETYAKGYIFSDPTMRVKDSSMQVLIEGIFFQINGLPIPSQTTFTSLSRVVAGDTPIPLMVARANTLIEPLSTSDVFQLYIRRLVPTSGTEEGAPPLTPILRVTDTETGSDTLMKSNDVNVSILRDASILRWCLTENPTAPATSDDVCQSGLTGPGTLNGWSLSRPRSFTLSSGEGTKNIYLWVADQNLNMNAEPGVVSVSLDTVAPAAPVINSINVTDSQVASMSVSHADESDVGGWCVFEQNAIQPAPTTVSLTDGCWNWTDNSAKPTTVGFKEGGMRNVWLFVRDRAGNISAPSNMRSANNSFGAITFSQLTDASGGPRAIFRNRCFTCHGSSANPGFSKLQLFDYASAIVVAESGVLVSRINNPISPMPNVGGGLMPQRERDLIRLWTLPEDGGDPLP